MDWTQRNHCSKRPVTWTNSEVNFTKPSCWIRTKSLCIAPFRAALDSCICRIPLEIFLSYSLMSCRSIFAMSKDQVESNTFFYTDTRCGTISSWWRWWRSKNVTESSNAFCRYFFHFSSLMAFAGLATFLHAFPWSVRQDACWMPTGQLCYATIRCILEDSQYTGWFGCVGHRDGTLEATQEKETRQEKAV